MKNMSTLTLTALIGASFWILACASAADTSPGPDDTSATPATPASVPAPVGATQPTVPGQPVASGGAAAVPGETPAPGVDPEMPGEPVDPGPGGEEPVTPVTPGPVNPVTPQPVIPIDADIPNPFTMDWAKLTEQATNGDDVNQCVGFQTPGVYRNFTPLDSNANPKEGDVCPGAGNTALENGSCNVPCGFERKGSPIGNKFCSCAGGIINDCGCSPLPGIVFNQVAACDTIWDGYDPANPLSFAKQMDEIPCAQEWDSCLTPDLPDACEWTTPKGCICLVDKNGAQVWQCGSTNNWFSCAEDTCPASFAEAGVIGSNVKAWCNAQ